MLSMEKFILLNTSLPFQFTQGKLHLNNQNLIYEPKWVSKVITWSYIELRNIPMI